MIGFICYLACELCIFDIIWSTKVLKDYLVVVQTQDCGSMPDLEGEQLR